MYDIEVCDILVEVVNYTSTPQYLDVTQVNQLIERLEAARDAVVENVRQRSDRRAAFLADLSLAGKAMKEGKKILAIKEVRSAFTKLYPGGSGVGLWEAKSIVEAFAND
jgi:ribosomal protein L7/L12